MFLLCLLWMSLLIKTMHKEKKRKLGQHTYMRVQQGKLDKQNLDYKTKHCGKSCWCHIVCVCVVVYNNWVTLTNES